MTPVVRAALDTYAKQIGSTRSDVIESLVRSHLGMPTIALPVTPPAPKRKPK